MKALSLHQPWATLLLSRYKRIETRSWGTSYRGALLIHATRQWNSAAVRFCQRLLPAYCLGSLGHISPFDHLPRGALLGRVDLVDCRPVTRLGPHDATMTELAFGDFGPGRWAWLTRHPVVFAQPIPYAGQPRLFEVPDDLLEPAA